MGLRDIKLATTAIEVPGNEPLVVRGLSMLDISALADIHLPALTLLFGQVVNRQSLEMDSEGVLAFGQSIITTAPALAADVIARGTGEPELSPIAAGLPFPTQLELLEAIIKLTFATEGALKNVVEIAVRALQGTTKAVAQLQS